MGHEGISNSHCEVRLNAGDAASGSAPSLTITDTSANGTGLQLPGEALVRLAKDKPTPISSGSQIALPMKVKKAEDGKQQQASFVVSFDSPSGVQEPAQES